MNEKISDERLKEKIEETKEYIDLCEERKFYPLYGVAERLSIYEELLSLRALNARLVEDGDAMYDILMSRGTPFGADVIGELKALKNWQEHTALMKESGNDRH